MFFLNLLHEDSATMGVICFFARWVMMVFASTMGVIFFFFVHDGGMGWCVFLSTMLMVVLWCVSALGRGLFKWGVGSWIIILQ